MIKWVVGLLTGWALAPALLAQDSGIDLSIEGMRSQQFSVGMFFFLLFGILLFAVIVFGLLFGRGGKTKLRTGEKVMFGAIILGIFAAIFLAAAQMLHGYLI